MVSAAGAPGLSGARRQRADAVTGPGCTAEVISGVV